MATRETREARGRRLGDGLERRLVGELIGARNTANVSRRKLASIAGMSQTDLWRVETMRRRLTVVDVARIAVALGLEASASLHPAGDPVRDKGHQTLIGRFRHLLAAAWQVAAELPFPKQGDQRTWDLVVRIPIQAVGVECETRLRDVQAFVRRIHQREESGGVDLIVVVLGDTTVNRQLVRQLREALGDAYSTDPAAIVRALGAGQALPGSGVVLL